MFVIVTILGEMEADDKIFQRFQLIDDGQLFRESGSKIKHLTCAFRIWILSTAGGGGAASPADDQTRNQRAEILRYAQSRNPGSHSPCEHEDRISHR